MDHDRSLDAARDRPWLRHYDYWVPARMTYPARPLSDILDAACIDVPDRTATVFLGAELTFADIKDRSDRLAIALARLGIAKGDRVAIMLPNCPQYLIASFAILRLGAIVVNVNPTYTSREVLQLASDSGARAVLTLDRLAPMWLEALEGTSVEHVIVTSLGEYSAEQAAPPHCTGALSFTEMLEQVSDRSLPLTSIGPGDVAVLQYTGGTTGTPKAAMLTHGNLFANVVQHEVWMYRTRAMGEARYLMVIPYFHIYAFTVGMLTATWIGAQQIMIPKYDVEQVLTAIKTHRPTFLPAVPTIFISLLSHPRAHEYGLDRVRTFNSGGAPCPVEVIAEFERRTGRALKEGYGLSETSPVTHSTPQLAIRKPGTIGLPISDTDIKVVDVETGTRVLPAGECGELCICGPQVMKGYWNRPDETANALRVDESGRVWFHTGDIAHVDEDGFTTIVQRKKDLIIVDGFNVYPSDVEGVLYTHPAVQMAAVIGVPHPYHGETVKACVVRREGMRVSEAELLTHCAAGLAEFKRPRQIEFRDSLPQSAVGKILYRVLREEIVSKRSVENT
jgi:long-chain acyl-CoA synthetase